MIGRRLANESSDREFALLFKNTWKITEHSLANIISQKKVNDFKAMFDKWERKVNE